MFFRKKITVHDFVLRIRRDLDHARLHHLQTNGLIDSPLVPDLDKIAISQVVDTTIADIVLVGALMNRVVDHGPELPRQAFLLECTFGLREAYSQRNVSEERGNQILDGVLGGVQAMFSQPVASTPRELWERQYTLALPEFQNREAHYAFFAALIAGQNKLLIPLLDKALTKFRLVLS